MGLEFESVRSMLDHIRANPESLTDNADDFLSVADSMDQGREQSSTAAETMKKRIQALEETNQKLFLRSTVETPGDTVEQTDIMCQNIIENFMKAR